MIAERQSAEAAADKRPPSASVISRALRRDAGIISTPRSRTGYHVSAGRISVDISDHPEQRQDKRAAADLRDHLIELGWQIDLDADSTGLNIRRVPTAAERTTKGTKP